MSLNGKIDNLSNLVVSKYTEDGIPLNETICKIAEAEHFNENHIARLVEMSNKKTFLKVFPEKHSFEVASVPAVMESLRHTKEASVMPAHSRDASLASRTHGDAINYKLLTLYKPEDNTKSAGHTEKHATQLVQERLLEESKIKKAIEELSFESRQKSAEMLDCEDKLVDITKQAILRGSSFADLETYTLSTLDEKQKEASEALGRVYNRVRNMPFVEKRASERGRRVEPFVGESNIYTDMVEKIIKNAEDIPMIERGIDILREKT